MSVIVERIASAISGKSRTTKWLQFLDWSKTTASTTIIDIGVNTHEYSENDNLLERLYSYPENITAVGLESDWTEFQTRYPKVKTQTADGTKLPFADESFDIAYSNAVIEHVGTREQQIAFLREMKRIARRGYLTTPNRLFPIEVHTRTPLLHILLSKRSFDWFLQKIGKGWATGTYMNLLSEEELRSLLQEAEITRYSLIKNRFCGIAMTFTVYWDQ
jgi:2-polyprenyl-3-methyl-5-hydroxy-6-metoxy-1,4-benzoquinol methylase